MANLKEIRNRIASVSSTMQITSAMKMVSAAKLKKATDAIHQMRPYSDKLTELIQNLSSSFDSSNENPYVKIREKKKLLLIAVTSNRGLCGGFNSNIIKETDQIVAKNQDKQIKILSIGKKGTDIFSKKYEVTSSHDEVFNNLNYENTSHIADLIMKSFMEEEFDCIEIVYNRFKNAASQIVTTETFLPIVPKLNPETSNSIDYIYEPSQEKIINELLPKALKTQLLKVLKDSFASEHGARMTAMHKATDNAGELRDQLKLTYNKARQASITNEILEIVGGAEALNN
ncbi:MAG: ATP synthase F1 subunit gamma [Flavobacteriales bacterium]|jgi:F-type H+-transporting ATPase subunit gamma|nr:ATP synthase F1 subunit gamma [Flavobacteriales bacterium]|tara:strand:- start:15135 stop:15995 length:861 start_codon:yes stop_codon:yes gene_type:complete